MPAWLSVERELTCWGDAGLTARFWVRDDDACHATPQLERLSRVAVEHGIEIGLGVIPGKIGEDLVSHLNSGATPFFPMCHGWMHVNYGRAGKPAEFGPERPRSVQVDDLSNAYVAFRSAFDVPAVFVPPFNRIDPAIAQELPGVGFAALSSAPTITLQRLARIAGRGAYLPALPARLPIAVRPLDVQIDPVDWASGTARPTQLVVETLLGELVIRRKGYIDPGLPIGILLHHLVHDGAIWAVCEDVLGALKSHPAVAFPRLTDLMPRSAGLGQSHLAAE